MVSGRDVPADKLIGSLATKMKGIVEAPEWSQFVKTGAHAERVPDNPDWWYTRSASLLRKIYMRGPIGVGKLRGWYGGKKNRGSRPERHVDAGGKIIRTCLQQLEKAGLIQSVEKKGRVITPAGQKLVDKTAAEVNPRVEKPKIKPAPKKAVKKKAPAKKKAPKDTPKEEPKPKEEKPKAKPAAKKKSAAKPAASEKPEEKKE